MVRELYYIILLFCNKSFSLLRKMKSNGARWSGSHGSTGWDETAKVYIKQWRSLEFTTCSYNMCLSHSVIPMALPSKCGISLAKHPSLYAP
jgi:hypothetical protein